MSGEGEPPPGESGEGESQDVVGGEELASLQTQVTELTALVKSLVQQQAVQVESSVSSARPASGGTEYVGGEHQSMSLLRGLREARTQQCPRPWHTLKRAGWE